MLLLLALARQAAACGGACSCYARARTFAAAATASAPATASARSPSSRRWWTSHLLASRPGSSYVVTSRFETPEIPECNFAQKVMQNWQSFGSKPAIVEADTNRTVTYSQLSDSVKRVASALRKMGFSAKDVLSISSTNNPEYPIFFFSVLSIGGITLPINPVYTKGEIASAFGLTKNSFVLCTSANLGVIQEAIASLPDPKQVKKIIVLGGMQQYGSDSRVVPVSALLEDDGSAFDGKPVAVDSKNDIVCLPLSSGTTGLPKAVMLTHYNLTANLVQIWREPVFPIKAADTLAAVLPFYHIYGLLVVMSVGLHSGARLVTYSKWDPVLFLSSIERHRVNVVPIVPPLILFMSKDPVTSRFDLTSMEHVTSGSAPLGAEMSKEFLNKFPHVKTLCQGYGLSETSPVTHLNMRNNWRAGAAGELIPGVEAKIVDVSTGLDCPSNEQGELLVRGPNIMKGYLNNPVANADTLIEDGWMRTGDIAYYDKDGFFYIVDRLKELIKYKGAQVAPAELEAVLLSHPAIRDAAVIGIPDVEAGELPRAYVCLKPGQSVSEAAIASYVAEQVAPAKRLRGGVVFVSEIPKLASGKNLRRVLKAQALAEIKNAAGGGSRK